MMAKARSVTDEMFTSAAKALAGCVAEEEICRGQLYPEMARLREVSATVSPMCLASKATDWQRESAIALHRHLRLPGAALPNVGDAARVELAGALRSTASKIGCFVHMC